MDTGQFIFCIVCGVICIWGLHARFNTLSPIKILSEVFGNIVYALKRYECDVCHRRYWLSHNAYRCCQGTPEWRLKRERENASMRSARIADGRDPDTGKRLRSKSRQELERQASLASRPLPTIMPPSTTGRTCPDCGGTGRKHGLPCDWCGGSGKLPRGY